MPDQAEQPVSAVPVPDQAEQPVLVRGGGMHSDLVVVQGAFSPLTSR